MATAKVNLSALESIPLTNPSKIKIGLVVSEWNKKITDKLLEQYQAMKCSSLLRETMWSMVSEITSSLDFNYQEYTEDYYSRFKKSYEDLIN